MVKQNKCIAILLAWASLSIGKNNEFLQTCHAFTAYGGFASTKNNRLSFGCLQAAKGFGAPSSSSKKKKGKKNKNNTKKKTQSPPSPLMNPLLQDARRRSAAPTTGEMVERIQQESETSCIGQAVKDAKAFFADTNKGGGGGGGEELDPFWDLMPSLLRAKFPNAANSDMIRVAGFVRHALHPSLEPKVHTKDDPHASYRPLQDIHAYMPGLSPTRPFHDPSLVELCAKLSENIDVITKEYNSLLEHMKKTHTDRFQSVTTMNYESGWKTLVLFYNGHRIPNFPYHVCPVTTSLLEEVPLAGRIAGFNRQQPQTGIPKHTDGNNMWLTCQMGVKVPEGEKAYIRVGPETKHWKQGECLLYDTTYEHETMNEHPDQERVVLHVDFFNTISMTPLEIDVMKYIYKLREEFMKAEGVRKVGAQIL